MLDFPWVSRLQQHVFVVHCMGITVLKDHTLWQMFMPLPANSLMQSAWHVTAHICMVTPAAQITDDTAFKHNGTLYILWLSMKMDVYTALKLILSKMAKPCLTMSPLIQGTHLLREHIQTSIFLNFHHVSWYPPCTHTAVSQLYMENVGYSFHKSLQRNG